MIKDIDQFMATRKEIMNISGVTRLESAIMPLPFPFSSEGIHNNILDGFSLNFFQQQIIRFTKLKMSFYSIEV
jgi:hypothetical protein